MALADVFKHVYWGFYRSDDFCGVSQALLLRSIRLQLVDSSLLDIFVEGLDKQGFAPGGLYHGQTTFGSRGPHKVRRRTLHHPAG